MDTVDTKPLNLQTRESAVSPRVLSVLASRNITLDDVLRMSRQAFEALDDAALWNVVSDDDRTTLIRFKHGSMTEAEKDAYFAPTEEEYDEIECDPEVQAYREAISGRQL